MVKYTLGLLLFTMSVLLVQVEQLYVNAQAGSPIAIKWAREKAEEGYFDHQELDRPIAATQLDGSETKNKATTHLGPQYAPHVQENLIGEEPKQGVARAIQLLSVRN